MAGLEGPRAEDCGVGGTVHILTKARVLRLKSDALVP